MLPAAELVPFPRPAARRGEEERAADRGAYIHYDCSLQFSLLIGPAQNFEEELWLPYEGYAV